MPRKNNLPKSQPEESNDTPTENESESEIELTADEDLFITEFFKNNLTGATEVYKKLHPKAQYNSCRSAASRLLAKDNIRAEIRRRLDLYAMSEDEAVLRLSEMARGDIGHFLRPGPDGFMYLDLSHEDAKKYYHLIKEVETKRERRIVGVGESAEEWEGEWVKIKLHSKYEAIIDILKLKGKFTKKLDILSDGKPIQSQQVIIYIPSNGRDDSIKQ